MTTTRYTNKKIVISHPRTPYIVRGVKLGKQGLCCAVAIAMKGRGYKVLHIPTGVTLVMLKHMDECVMFVSNFEEGLTDLLEREVLEQLSWERACIYDNNFDTGDRAYDEMYKLLRSYACGLMKLKSERMRDQLKYSPEFL